MAKKPAHPTQLFQYLNGAVDAKSRQRIEAHLSECDDCAAVASVVRALKEVAPARSADSEIAREHPNVGELASFFYSSRPSAPSHVAAHVAHCPSCAAEVAQYARAERAASEYRAVEAAAGEVPAKAWEMIRDWEESGFAKLKPASEAISHEFLDRLSRHLTEQQQAQGVKTPRREAVHERVPVLVVSSSGDVRSVEFFHKSVDSTGASVLTHAEGSRRFDDQSIHLLLEFNEDQPVVISEVVSVGKVRLQPAPQRSAKPLRKAYFIIED